MVIWNISLPFCLHISADGDIKQSILPTTSPKETFNLDAKSISIYFEIETLDLHVPILCVQVAMEAKVEEWSKQVGIFFIEVFICKQFFRYFIDFIYVELYLYTPHLGTILSYSLLISFILSYICVHLIWQQFSDFLLI